MRTDMPLGLSGTGSAIPASMPKRCLNLLARLSARCHGRVGELIAMSAQKIAAREVQLGYAPSALSAVSRSGADEIGATAAEPTTQMDDGDGLGHFFASPVPDPHGVGETQPLSLRA